MVNRSKVTDSLLKEAVENSHSVLEVLRFLGKKEAGGSHSYFSARIRRLNLDTSHFKGQASNKGKPSITKKSAEEILVRRKEGRRAKASQLKRALLQIGIKHECSLCGQLPEWRGNPLTLDIDHINQYWLDDRAENLRFLCPNCHSQFSRNLLGS